MYFKQFITKFERSSSEDYMPERKKHIYVHIDDSTNTLLINIIASNKFINNI